MKKLTISAMTALLLLSFSPAQLSARTESTPITAVATTPSTEANALLVRLDEINTMDKSNLSRSERKQLRKEVRSIKHTLSINNGGVYLSAGAIIIIILLLILLL